MTAWDRGLYGTIIGMDIISTTQNQPTIVVVGATPIGATSVAQLVYEWIDCNNTAYNQILLCISPELQTTLDNTHKAAVAWIILRNKFESHNL